MGKMEMKRKRESGKGGGRRGAGGKQSRRYRGKAEGVVSIVPHNGGFVRG